MNDKLVFTGDSGTEYVCLLDRPLGLGRFGGVYEGYDVRGTTAVAIKRIAINTSTATRFVNDSTLVEREITAMRKLRSINSPYVLQLIDFCWHADDGAETLLIVMPLADESLEERLTRGALPEAEARQLLFELSKGLSAIHSKGVIHRDVKPGNILRLEGRWALADFGIALDEDVGQSTLTWHGTGTREYWAPELFVGDSATVSSDLYAAGITVLEAINGEPVFAGADLRKRHTAEVPVVPDLKDQVLARMIFSLLAKRSSSRPVDARQVSEGLEVGLPIASDQSTLLTLRALQLSENLRREGATATLQLEEEVRADAFRALLRVWEQTVERARAVAPETEANIKSDAPYFEHFLTIDSDRLRLIAQRPSDRNLALVVGSLELKNADEDSLLRLANIYCEGHSSETIVWWLSTYSSNGMAQDRTSADAQGRRNEGVDIELLEAFLAEKQDRLPVKMFVEERKPLTASRVLQTFVDAAVARRT